MLFVAAFVATRAVDVSTRLGRSDGRSRDRGPSLGRGPTRRVRRKGPGPDAENATRSASACSSAYEAPCWSGDGRPIERVMPIVPTLLVLLAVMSLYIMRRRVRLGRRKPTF